MSHKATRNADSSSHVGHPASQSTGSGSSSLLLTALFSRLVCSTSFSWLVSSELFLDLPSVVLFWSRWRSNVPALCVGFASKQKGSSDWYSKIHSNSNWDYQFETHLNVKYEDHSISFQTFFVWALLLIVHTWNSSPLRSNILRLHLLYRSNNFWKVPWKFSWVRVSMTFVTASFISIVS